MALGAAPRQVRVDVLRRAGAIVGSGVAVGLIVALMMSRLLTSLLFQVSPTDPVALGLACLALGCVAAAAAYLPARWATSIDPVQALRAE
jgi:ABC-type antimicrobial peptide transport system permease subunit